MTVGGARRETNGPAEAGRYRCAESVARQERVGARQRAGRGMMLGSETVGGIPSPLTSSR